MPHAKIDKRFDAVLFDLGGTLIWFDGIWPEVVATQHRAMIQYLTQIGYQVDEDRFARDFLSRLTAYYKERDTEFIEYTTEYLLHSLLEEYGYRKATSADLRPALDIMYAVSEAHWRAEQDTHETLTILKNQGYKLGLISNANDSVDVQKLIDQEDLRHFFDIILISADLGRRKPHPAVFNMALEQIGVLPERAVMVGDTLGADILGARNACMSSVWITRRAVTPDNRDHEDTILPDAVISTLCELPDLLANWSENPH